MYSSGKPMRIRNSLPLKKTNRKQPNAKRIGEKAEAGRLQSTKKKGIKDKWKKYATSSENRLSKTKAVINGMKEAMKG